MCSNTETVCLYSPLAIASKKPKSKQTRKKALSAGYCSLLKYSNSSELHTRLYNICLKYRNIILALCKGKICQRCTLSNEWPCRSQKGKEYLVRLVFAYQPNQAFPIQSFAFLLYLSWRSQNILGFLHGMVCC